MGGNIEKTLRIGGGGDFKLSISSDSFQKDGRKISVGDCALFKPPYDSAPFIAIITSLLPDKDNSNNLFLLVNWLYRPSELEINKNILPKPNPNEIFYSFHTDKIPAASLLHPCKVAFLPKNIELPSNISCYVCTRVYDTVKKCLWWLTDQNFINERQEEVDKLLYKTRIEMRTTVQPSDGSSPKSINGPTNTSQSTPGSDKGKKRDRGEKSSESLKRGRAVKTDDSDSENSLKSEIAKITEMSSLVDFEGVEKLVHAMQMDREENNMDLTSRSMFASVLAATEKFECLNKFIELKGLTVLDQWLQDIHKGKIGDNESEQSVEEFLHILLGALDKLPVTLQALQMCNIGKSVNIYLSKHKSLEIQRRAKSLVDTWKKRVDEEMKGSSANKLSKKRDTPSKSSVTQLSKVSPNKETVKSTSLSPRTVKESPPNGPPSEVMYSPKSSTGGSLSVNKRRKKHKSGSGSGGPKEKAVEGQSPGESQGQGQKLILKIQMKKCSPGERSTSDGSSEEPMVMSNRASSSPELSNKNNEEQLDHDLVMKEANNNINNNVNNVNDVNTESCESNDVKEDGSPGPTEDKEQVVKKVDDLSKGASSSSEANTSSMSIVDDLGNGEMCKADVAVDEGANADVAVNEGTNADVAVDKADKKDDVAVPEGDGKETSSEMIKNEPSDEGNNVIVSDKVEDANDVVMEDQVCNNVKMEEEDINPVVKAEEPVPDNNTDSRMVIDLNEAIVNEENPARINQAIYPIARRGPFIPQPDMFVNTDVENGWTGSSDTSAFHRPEPRRVPLFDLNNVSDENENFVELLPGGLSDLDLNRIEQPQPIEFLLPTSGVHMDFDLNDGPSVDDLPPAGQGRNFATTWFPPGNIYSTVTVSSTIPDRNVGPAHRALPMPFPFPCPNYPLPPFTVSAGSTLSDGRFFTPPVPVNGTVSSFYPRPYMSMGTTTILAEANNNRWGPPGFDLNSGPGAEGQGRNVDATGGTLPDEPRENENQPPWQ